MSSPAGGVFAHRRLRRLAEKIAQRADAGAGRGGILRAGKREDAPAAVGLDRVAEVNRLGVRDANDRRGMKPHADRQPFGEMLIGRLAGEQRGAVARRGPGGVAPVPDEIALGLGRIEAFAR